MATITIKTLNFPEEAHQWRAFINTSAGLVEAVGTTLATDWVAINQPLVFSISQGNSWQIGCRTVTGDAIRSALMAEGRNSFVIPITEPLKSGTYWFDWTDGKFKGRWGRYGTVGIIAVVVGLAAAYLLLKGKK